MSDGDVHVLPIGDLIEHDDAETVRGDVAAWRDGHRCGGVQPWRRSVESTSDVRMEFGFQRREDEVRVRG